MPPLILFLALLLPLLPLLEGPTVNRTEHLLFACACACTCSQSSTSSTALVGIEVGVGVGIGIGVGIGVGIEVGIGVRTGLMVGVGVGAITVGEGCAATLCYSNLPHQLLQNGTQQIVGTVSRWRTATCGGAADGGWSSGGDGIAGATVAAVARIEQYFV